MITFSNLVETLQQHASPDRSITYIEGKDKELSISYADLHERALNRLFALQQRGLSQGDECIIFLRSNEDFIDVFWGCVLGGIIPVPIAVGISDEHRSKLFKIFDKLEHPHLYTSDDITERLQAYADENQQAETYKKIKEKTLLVNEIKSVSGKGEIHTPNADDLAFIQFSSGSTSDPKGVMLTHKNIMTNLNAIGEGAKYNDQDISFSWMPLTHDMGLIGFHLNMIAYRMSQCLMATDLFSRRPLLWMEKVSEKKATVLCSPNFGYKHFLKSLSKKSLDNVDLSGVRLIYNGAEPISTELCDTFLNTMKEYGLKRETMFTVYGMAEATLAVSFPVVNKEFRAVHVDRHSLKVGEKIKFIDEANQDALSFAIVGKPVLNCKVRIADQENVFADETVGSIQIAGPNVTQGYYKNEEANHSVITADGWLDTGDLGFIFNDELIITGRAKDIIFANGLNYYPHDLEDLLLGIDGLELGKVVVYGVWNEKLQRDELIIFILYRADIKDFADLAKKAARTLNEQSGLEIDHVIPVNRIPKTTSGKVQRRILGDAYAEGEYAEVLSEIEKLSQPAESTAEESLTPLQQELKMICDDVIEGSTLGVNDNFFESGISSLTLAEIHQQIDDRYPGKVDVVDLFEYQTIIELAEFMQDKV
ncbi:MAG: non-ribosomal peptide synthetase [Gammaproteobacteria bacterium]|nr:non-ribosomal peptide synthetase [Gammaproteobacteria bacterium]MCW8987365.1 non-ribosomal peptide synthetase [Gammaproteobacteria bacterium]